MEKQTKTCIFLVKKEKGENPRLPAATEMNHLMVEQSLGQVLLLWPLNTRAGGGDGNGREGGEVGDGSSGHGVAAVLSTHRQQTSTANMISYRQHR